MKAISIKQPWASLIVAGIKPVENRTWKSNYRGQLLIHASKRFDYEGEQWIMRMLKTNRKIDEITRVLQGKMPRGGVIGSVFMADCVTEHPSPWFSGPYGFVFDYPVSFPFIACSGKLSLFDIDYAALSFDALTKCQ